MKNMFVKLFTIVFIDSSLNIDFNNPVSLKCSEVEVFHTLYVMLEIAAPILVILFGTLDYAKAVMSSDVEKIEKSKKKFPKRVLLLVLFLFIPVIINFLVGSFSSTNANLMWCIIKGS